MELCVMYHCSQSAISELVIWVVTYLDEHWKHLLDCDVHGLVSHEKLQEYDIAIEQQGVSINTVIGWPDCIKFYVCHPRFYQHMAYNRHDHIHCLKFQAIVLSNGMVANLYGPMER